MDRSELHTRSRGSSSDNLELKMEFASYPVSQSSTPAIGIARCFPSKALRKLHNRITDFIRLRKNFGPRTSSLKLAKRSAHTSQSSSLQQDVQEDIFLDGEGEEKHEAYSKTMHHNIPPEELREEFQGTDEEGVIQEEVEEVSEANEALIQDFANLEVESSTRNRAAHVVNSSLTEFLFFPRLPTELRLMIWAFSLPEGCIISLNIGQFRLYRQGEELLLNVSYAPSQPPHLNDLGEPPKSHVSLLAASRESRMVFLEKFNHTVPIRYYYKGTRYFGNSDTIYLESVPYDLDSTAIFQAVELGHKPGPFFNNVTRLALNVNAFDKNYLFGSLFPQPIDEDKVSIFKFLELFGNLKVLTIFGASNPWDEEYNQNMVAICESGIAELRRDRGGRYKGPTILYAKPVLAEE